MFTKQIISKNTHKSTNCYLKTKKGKDSHITRADTFPFLCSPKFYTSQTRKKLTKLGQNFYCLIPIVFFYESSLYLSKK